MTDDWVTRHASSTSAAMHRTLHPLRLHTHTPAFGVVYCTAELAGPQPAALPALAWNEYRTPLGKGVE